MITGYSWADCRETHRDVEALNCHDFLNMLHIALALFATHLFIRSVKRLHSGLQERGVVFFATQCYFLSVVSDSQALLYSGFRKCTIWLKVFGHLMITATGPYTLSAT